MHKLIICIFGCLILSCSTTPKTKAEFPEKNINSGSLINPTKAQGKVGDYKSVNEIPLPKGYSRIATDSGSFAWFVQHLGVTKNSDAKTYTGNYIGWYGFGIIDYPLLFEADLEQCADWSMRLWAEYHKSENKTDQLFLFNYSGKKQLFSTSGKSFNSFLKNAFAYSNSHSIKKGCKTISDNDIQPGDLVVQNEGGGIGHVSVIMDVCQNQQGEKLYLIGYSFMPAQEMHIDKAYDEYGVDGWYSLDGFYRYLEENLNIGAPTLRRF